ncbi:hypothetical protein DB88DRAFT_511733 [Papiliotrema laurentii]|uniref:Uncharacterized protein n=1 Tax=Papiliotrema laurentii TaxID=5418 RepID=A0AAD9CW45_PAPLA|nr:hypothetical protein DB88DRAFT_511733 [Papiliotrema laurentii]
MSDPFASPTSSAGPSTSTWTPPRPPRSIHRSSTHSSLTLSSMADPLDIPPIPLTPSTLSTSTSTSSPFDVAPQTPATPERIYTEGRERLDTRKSDASIRRKPVRLSLDTLEHDRNPLPTASTRTIDSASSTNNTLTRSSSHLHLRDPLALPTFTLPVDPPSYHTSEDGFIHVTLPRPAEGIHPTPLRAELGMASVSTSTEELPRYTEEKATEPKTLARAFWRWGWLCPLLWGIGMCILWIPLRSEEQETDPEKVQRLEEMIVILREASEIIHSKSIR